MPDVSGHKTRHCSVLRPSTWKSGLESQEHRMIIGHTRLSCFKRLSFTWNHHFKFFWLTLWCWCVLSTNWFPIFSMRFMIIAVLAISARLISMQSTVAPPPPTTAPPPPPTTLPQTTQPPPKPSLLCWSAKLNLLVCPEGWLNSTSFPHHKCYYIGFIHTGSNQKENDS